MALVVLMFAFPSPAQADSATITVTTTTGSSDPVAGVPRIVTVSGIVASPKQIYVKYRAAGGVPCAGNSSSDPGSTLDGFYAQSVSGTFNLQDVIELSAPGRMMFCTWPSNGGATTMTTPIMQLIDFRPPAGSIAVAARTAKLRRGVRLVTHMEGFSEAPATVSAKVRLRRAGGPSCAATYRAAAGHVLLEGAAASGRFALEPTATLAKPGAYLVCAWLTRSTGDQSPVAGPTPATFDIARSRCIVPSVGAGQAFASVRRRIRAAHCRIGRILKLHSPTVHKGAVIRLARSAHSRLPGGTSIDVVVSSGRAR